MLIWCGGQLVLSISYGYGVIFLCVSAVVVPDLVQCCSGEI
jgi:hypothetical protein